MAASKVVRVEDVLEASPDTPSSQLQLLTQTPATADKSTTAVNSQEKSHSDSASAKEGSSLSGKDGDEPQEEYDEAEKEEKEDKVYPLPENWPRIKELKRPMSCALSRSRLPCVRKAVSHLELIQNIIDEWFRRTVEEAKSRASTAQSARSLQVPPSQKKQLRFRDPSTPSMTRTTLSSASHSSHMSRESSASTMAVEGIGVAEEPQEEEEEDEGLDIPYLGAEDVIEETVTLLARLELDRQETQNSLQKETEVVTTLRKKINDLRLRRLREMPMLVQREHEACIVDLNELNWHVAYVTRTLAKAQNRKDMAEVLNNRLKEDIAFVKQHIPLVKEKLVLELQAMDRIKKAQVETNQELMTTKQRQAKTEQKSTEAMNKAETERGHIKRELDTVRDNLSQISEELSTAKMAFNSYVHQVNDINMQLTDNAQELQVLDVKNTNAKSAEEMQATKVRALQNKIAEAEFEYQRLAYENEQAEQELKILKAKNQGLLTDLLNEVKALETKHRKVSRKNQELSLIIEDTQDKIHKCEEQKIADEKNIRRIQRELERVATMMAATMEEHFKVSQTNHHVRDQLTLAQEKAFRTEEQLKNTAETLRRQVKEEMHTRTVLQARINSDSTEIEKTRAESGKKKQKADKVATDVTTAVNGVLEKVEKLRSTKAEKDKQIADTKEQLAELEKKHASTEAEFRDRLSSIMPHYNSLKGEVGKLDKQLDHMAWKTDLMNKKIEEMDGAQGMMDKVSAKTQASITELTAQLEELKIQLETAQKIGNDLRQQYQAVLDRLKDGENRQHRFLGDRSQVLKDQEQEKVRCLAKNKELASRYRQLQNDFLIMKEKLLRSYDECLKLEATITDVKQLKSLQSKMHGALAEYFKLSGLYNEGELVRLEQMSSENGMKVGKLQGDMEEALNLITTFLQTEMDGTRARQMAWEAVRKMEQQQNGKGGEGVGVRTRPPTSSVVMAS